MPGKTAAIAGSLAERIAAALERLAPPRTAGGDIKRGDAFIWHAAGETLQPVAKSTASARAAQGIDQVRDILIANTQRFALGLPANNALLWGARGWAKARWSKRRMPRWRKDPAAS